MSKWPACMSSNYVPPCLLHRPKDTRIAPCPNFVHMNWPWVIHDLAKPQTKWESIIDVRRAIEKQVLVEKRFRCRLESPHSFFCALNIKEQSVAWTNS